jgi:hypothetical protein
MHGDFARLYLWQRSIRKDRIANAFLRQDATTTNTSEKMSDYLKSLCIRHLAKLGRCCASLLHSAHELNATPMLLLQQKQNIDFRRTSHQIVQRDCRLNMN